MTTTIITTTIPVSFPIVTIKFNSTRTRLFFSSYFLTARRYASVVLAVIVYLSVCLVCHKSVLFYYG